MRKRSSLSSIVNWWHCVVRKIPIIPVSGAWYGFDPIHLERRRARRSLAGDARRLARRRTTIQSCAVTILDERIPCTISGARAHHIWDSQAHGAAEWSPVGWNDDFSLLNALALRSKRFGAPNCSARVREAAIEQRKFFTTDKIFGKNMLH